MVALVQGPSRDQTTCDKLVEDFAARTKREAPDLTTTDEHAPYRKSLLKVYGVDFRPRRRAKRGRKRNLKKRRSGVMIYATVKKTREKGRVVNVRTEVVLGTEAGLSAVLEVSPSSSTVNTSFVERNNGTSRHFNSRKQRKTYGLSKQLAEHVAMTWLMVTHYNFCWAHRMLRVRGNDHHFTARSPGMAAGITDHVWSIDELLTRHVLSQRGA